MKKLFAVVVLAVLMGCAGTPIKWNKARQVKLGMTEPEVTALMGKPYMVSSREGGQRWIWTFATGFGGVESMTVDFKEGKVVSVPPIPDSFK